MTFSGVSGIGSGIGRLAGRPVRFSVMVVSAPRAVFALEAVALSDARPSGV